MLNVFDHRGTANQNNVDSILLQSEKLSSRRKQDRLGKIRGWAVHHWWEWRAVRKRLKNVKTE